MWKKQIALAHEKNEKLLAEARAKGLPESSVKKVQPSFLSACSEMAFWPAAFCVLMQVLIRVEQTCEPLVMEQILLWLMPAMPKRPQSEYYEGFIWGGALVLMILFQIFVSNKFFHIGYRLFVQVRTACCTIIYSKAIKVSGISEDPAAAAAAGGPGGKSGGPPGAEAAKKGPAGGPPAGRGGPGGPPGGGGQGNFANADGAMSTGQIVNLMAVDAEKCGMMFFLGWSSVLVPIQIAFILWLLYDTLGVAIFAGFGVVFIIVPCVLFCVLAIAKYTRFRMGISDQRVKLTNEVLQGIRIIKFYAWEYYFKDELESVRRKELNLLFKTNVMTAAVLFGFTIVTSLFSVVTFSVYSALGHSFQASNIFKGVAFINALQIPLVQLPNSLSQIAMGLISFRRIQDFLLQPELDRMSSIDCKGPLAFHKQERLKDEAAAKAAGKKLRYDAIAAAHVEGLPEITLDKDVFATQGLEGQLAPRSPSNAVELRHGSFSWGVPESVKARADAAAKRAEARSHMSQEDQQALDKEVEEAEAKRKKDIRLVLKDINFNAPKGKLTAIVGPVGCGKSSLLAGILGELNTVEGTVAKDPSASVAYVAQNAWIQTMSVRKNILFGGELTTSEEQKRYDLTVEACALLPDFAALDNGDETEIGDRGINLSGGQKQRVSIARAVYSDSDIYLFDDPLSAVDAHVAEHLFSKCFEDALAGKTRILVTNQLHFLPRCDYIYVMGSKPDETDHGDAPVEADATAAAAAGGGPQGDSNIPVVTLSSPSASTSESPTSSSSASPSASTGAVNGLTPAPAAAAAAAAEDAEGAAEGAAKEGDEHRALVAPASPRIRRTVGIIAEEGSYEQLQANGELFKSLMTKYRQSLESKEDVADDDEKVDDDKAVGSPGGEPRTPNLTANTDDVEVNEDGEVIPVLGRGNATPKVAPSVDHAGPSIPALTPAALGVQRSNVSKLSRTRSLSQSQASRSHKSGSRSEHQHVLLAAAKALQKMSGPKKGKQIAEEEMNTGAVPWTAYIFHLQTMGNWPVAGSMLFFAACGTAATVWLNMMLGYWTDDQYNETTSFYRMWYLIILAIAAVCLIFRGYFFSVGSVKASEYYHSRLLDRVLRASSVFFDTTPAGRIINRFSKDLDAVDTFIPNLLLNNITLGMSLIASMVTVATIYPYFTIALVVIAVSFYLLQEYYSPSAIQIQRIESNTRSPLLQHFNETLKGIMTVRAFNRVPQFQVRNFNLLNDNTTALYSVRMTYRWGALRVGFLQTLLVLAAVLLVVLTRGTLDVGLSGVVLSYMLSISGTVAFLVMLSIELQGKMNSVERLRHYLNSVPMEASLDEGVDNYEPPKGWPSQGVIEYKDVRMRYRPELPVVLKKLSFEIPGANKVGVVGRTGSGKSSLMMLLMRLYEIEKGQILIDGVDIKQMSLHALRSKIGIVPQDPVLFSGTIRANLDPFSQYSDADIYEALDGVNLKNYVQTLPDQLKHKVQEFGANFSQGQRQLICLARVLLKKPAILLLDEATSSVDSETDAQLQRALQTQFTNSTVLTIAHRLNTVMGSDKVMVLDKGDMAEYDSPAELIKEGPLTEPPQASRRRVTRKGIFAAMYAAYLKNSTDEDEGKVAENEAAAAAASEATSGNVGSTSSAEPAAAGAR